MCDTCGCDSSSLKSHDDVHTDKVHNVDADILGENNQLATFNRGWLKSRNVYAVNFVSSPGSGKTTILERCIDKLQNKCKINIIVADQQSDCDSTRLKKHGIDAYQINTENICHLDAHMIIHAMEKMNICQESILFIENIGNLVCPALFDLGENLRVVVISVTEGDDKPLKYPYMFAESDVCIINKIDLLPYVPCDIYTLKENCLKVNPNIIMFEMSAVTCEGIDVWLDYLVEQVKLSYSKQYFNELADDWDDQVPYDYEKIEYLLSKLDIKSGSCVLDIGTGTGILIPLLSSYVGNDGKVLGIDMSSNMITHAKRKFGLLRNVAFQVSDVDILQPEGTFNFIILYSVFPHLKRPFDTVVSLIKHHLAKNGKLFIAHSRCKEAINTTHLNLSGNLYSMEIPAIEELIKEFENRGVKVIEALDNDEYYYLILSNKND